jgi:anti-sigma B factor antagonist
MPHPAHVLSDVRTAAGVTAARLNTKTLDHTNAPVVGDELLRLAAAVGSGELHLDLAQLEYLSSSGLGKLVALLKRLRATGGKLRLCNVRPAVYEVFAMTQLTRLLNVQPPGEPAPDRA